MTFYFWFHDLMDECPWGANTETEDIATNIYLKWERFEYGCEHWYGEE